MVFDDVQLLSLLHLFLLMQFGDGFHVRHRYQLAFVYQFAEVDGV